MQHNVRSLRAGETPAAVAVLVDAFERDPFSQWLYPDGTARRAMHGQLFAEMISGDAPSSVVDVTDDLDAAAIWLPPDGRPDIDPPRAASPVATRLFAMLRETKPTGAFWYLAFLGARTPRTGAGSALMQHRLAALPGTVALWTGNEANIAFYARFGFEVGSRCDAPGASAWWMTRPPQSAIRRDSTNPRNAA